MPLSKNVLIFYYDRFAEFEIALALLYLGDHSLRTAAYEKREYRSMEGQRFFPDERLEDVDPTTVDLFVIPGGDPTPFLADRRLARFLASAVSGGATIAGICGGADILVALGFLEGKRCTGNALDPANPEVLKEAYSKTYFTNEHVTSDGAFITAQSDGFEEFASVLAMRLGAQAHQIPSWNEEWLSPIEGWTEVGNAVKVSTSKFEECNLSLVVSGKEALLVDTGYRKEEAQRVLTYLQKNDLKLKYLVITHHHEDHDANLGMFSASGPTFDPTTIGEGLTLLVGNETVVLFPTPGHHTKGDISVLVPSENILIAGDLLFSCLPPQLCYGAKPELVKETIQKLSERHFRWIVPGHGRVMTGDAMTSLSLSYIQTLEERVRLVAENHGTEEDLYGIHLSECIAHSDWMVEEPAIDLHRQNKQELFIRMQKPN